MTNLPRDLDWSNVENDARRDLEQAALKTIDLNRRREARLEQDLLRQRALPKIGRFLIGDLTANDLANYLLEDMDKVAYCPFDDKAQVVVRQGVTSGGPSAPLTTYSLECGHTIV